MGSLHAQRCEWGCPKILCVNVNMPTKSSESSKKVWALEAFLQSKKRTSTDAYAVGFLLAHFQHLLVDVTDHGPGFLRPVLCGVIVGNVLPRRRLHGPRRPPLLPLLLKTNVLQETEGNVTCRGGSSQNEESVTPAEGFGCVSRVHTERLYLFRPPHPGVAPPAEGAWHAAARPSTIDGFPDSWRRSLRHTSVPHSQTPYTLKKQRGRDDICLAGSR